MYTLILLILVAINKLKLALQGSIENGNLAVSPPQNPCNT